MAQLWNQLFVKNETLYQLFSGTEGSSSMMQLVVPDSMKEEILYGVHEGIGGGTYTLFTRQQPNRSVPEETEPFQLFRCIHT